MSEVIKDSSNNKSPRISMLSENVQDFQRDYLWKVSIAVPPLGLIGRYPEYSKAVLDNIDLWMNVIKTPSSNNKAIVLNWGGERSVWAGPSEAENTMDCEAYVDMNWINYDLLDACQQLTGTNESNASVTKPFYVMDIDLVLYAVDKETIVKKFTLKRAWIQKIDSIDLKKDGSDFAKFNFTIAFDKRVNKIGKLMDLA